MITIDHLTKRYKNITAVDGLSFDVGPGRVTGFLGPNGAGKTTTLRMLLGLARPDSGTAAINGTRYRDLPHPAQAVGAALDNDTFHPGRSAIEHLRVAATAAGISRHRPEQVLGVVGLCADRHRRVGTFSLGMRQRLTLATALLGDPGVLIMDEPLNGLDPDGIRWMRDLLRQLAGEGRTVLISSHLLPLGCGPLGYELTDPAHPAGGRVGVVAELLCHPAGAAADAELLDGAADRGGDRAGVRGV